MYSPSMARSLIGPPRPRLPARVSPASLPRPKLALKCTTIVAAIALAESCGPLPPLPPPPPATPYGDLLVIVRDAETGKAYRQPYVCLVEVPRAEFGDNRGRVFFQKLAPGSYRARFHGICVDDVYDSVEVRPWRIDTLVLMTRRAPCPQLE